MFQTASFHKHTYSLYKVERCKIVNPTKMQFQSSLEPCVSND